MIDMSLQGVKCRAVREIQSHQGRVSISTEGTIQYEIDNLGRHLINVLWDSGLSLNVFPGDIEILSGPGSGSRERS